MIATQNSFMQLLVGKNINRTASVTATDPSASAYAATGEIVVTDISGTVLDTTTVQGVSQIKIVQSQGATSPMISSPVIELAGVKSYGSKLYSAPTVQTDYIGYNAVTNAGSIDVINDNGYEVLIQDINSPAYGSTGIGKFGFYVSDSSATQTKVMDGIAISLYQNTARVVNKPFIVERVSSVAFTNSGTDALTLVNGSPTVTTSVGVTECVVGTYIKLGTSAVDTAAIYKVVAASGTTVTLDMPYQGTVLTFAIAAWSFATDAAVTAGSCGIRLTGKAPVFTSPASTEPYVNRWIIGLKNFGDTTTTNTVAGSEGSGSYPYTASLEYFLLGNEGFIARNNVPYQTPRANVLSTGTYNFLTLEWDSVKTGQIFNQQAASKQLLIAFDFTPASAPTQVTGVVTAVQDVLNVWINSAIGTGTLA